MLESIIFPKEGERKPWKLFLIGLLYSSLSFLIVTLIFSRDVVLSRYSGLLIVMFSVLFSIFFVHYTIKLDEKENIKDKSEKKALIDDWKILSMFLWLFIGLVIGFSFWQIVAPSIVSFNAQMETYCVINKPIQYVECVDKYKLEELIGGIESSPKGNFGLIFANNIYVLIFVLAFSLIFGAGAIFIIAWNASIISTVISYSIKYRITHLPSGLLRFMVHGLPEIAGYFVAAMAGGMMSLALSSFIRKNLSKDNLLKVMQRALYLIIIAIILLVIAALIEIFITPLFF